MQTLSHSPYLKIQKNKKRQHNPLEAEDVNTAQQKRGKKKEVKAPPLPRRTKQPAPKKKMDEKAAPPKKRSATPTKEWNVGPLKATPPTEGEEHHEEARETTKKSFQKEGEKIWETTPTPKKGRQVTPLLYFKVHICPIWFYLTSCTLATLFYYIPFHFISSHTGVRQHRPKGGGGKQHHPLETDEESSTIQKKLKGEGMQHPPQRRAGKGNNHFTVTYLTFILMWFNLSCANSVTLSIFKKFR